MERKYKAFVTSVSERTTQICCEQLEKYGFEVVLLDKKELWLGKYKKFIQSAQEDCLRVDADVIVNRRVKLIPGQNKDAWVIQNLVFDLYKLDLTMTSPVFYRKGALDIIKKNLDKLSSTRPEASALRLPKVNPRVFKGDWVVGLHGFLQDDETIKRARQNKIARGHLEKYNYDFYLVDKLKKLGW